MSTIRVRVKSGSYPIIVGSGISDQLAHIIGKNVPNTGPVRLFVFYDSRLFALHGRQVRTCLKQAGHHQVEFVIPSGEKSKSAAVLNRIYGFLLDEEINRSDFILAIGGGVTSDLVGYAAATTLRGIDWGIVPTTLLGMVDAAIGGKTGINHRSGKNLIGAFWQPRFVFCDTNYLETLDSRQIVAGIGEIAKYAGLMGPKMLAPLETYISSEELCNHRLLTRLVRLAAAYKADIVTRDEREKSLRMLLNLGHTFGHAIEKSVGYGRLLHGEAVLLGLYAIVELSCRMRPDRSSSFTKYRSLLEKLITCLPRRKIDSRATLQAMKQDKKRHGGRQKFVLLERPGRPIITDDVEQRMVEKSIENMIRIYCSRGSRHAKNSGR